MSEKRAPVQGYSAGIPWEMHLRAYDAYSKKYSPQPALIDLEGRGCRGGFGTRELDDFIPGWRDELSALAGKDREIAALREEIERFRAAWKIAEPFLPSPVYQRALAALNGNGEAK
jgi:hypothetical protein